MQNSPRRSALRLALTAVALVALLVTSRAQAETRTWNYLTTGNGHGFQVYDASRHRIVSFLEHPYRYIAPGADERSDGIGRRNLAFDVYFGVKTAAGSGWLSEPEGSTDPEYVDQTNIIRAPASFKGATTESFFFSPFGLERNAMVALLHAQNASQAFALMNFHLGAERTEPTANGESTRAALGGAAVIETGPSGGAMVYVAISPFDKVDCQGVFDDVRNAGDLANQPACAANDISLGFQRAVPSDGWMGLVVGYTPDAGQADAFATALQTWVAGRTPEKVLEDAKAEWTAWRKPPPEGTALCSDDEKKLWRQSETILRMGQVREPNTASRKNNGMVLASLPPGEWHSGWVRDAVYAIVALARMGHFAETKMALDFFFAAEPVGKYKRFVSNSNYRVSVVRYFGTGEEEADYSGQPSPNIETDGWGLVLWAARLYVELSGDTAWLAAATRAGTVYDAMNDGIGIPIEQNLESNGIMKADSSIWEVHDDHKRHFAYTTLCSARGLCDLAVLAKKAGRDADATRYKNDASRVKSAFLTTFLDREGAIAGSLEGLSANKYFDGAVAEAFTWNILPDFKGDTARATLDMLGKLRVESGGFKRNNDGLSSYDDNEWILVDLRIANSLRRAGRTAEADGVVAMIVTKAAANFYLLPELYNAVARDGQIGKYTGSIPMVGYGGGAYIITMLDRSGIIEPNDCGDAMGATQPKVTCGEVSVTPGTGGDGDGGAGTSGAAPSAAELPFVTACLCRHTPGSGPRELFLALCLFAPTALSVRRLRPRRKS